MCPIRTATSFRSHVRFSDRSVLEEWSASISVPTLVVGGDKSPKEVRDAVATVAKALPDARSQFLAGQNHNLSTLRSHRSWSTFSIPDRTVRNSRRKHCNLRQRLEVNSRF
jgi:hypothetical protein